MSRSSRHRSHKQSKHSSKDYPDSEEDVRTKDKGSRDENLAKASRDSATGGKRKISSQSREGKEGKDPNGCGNCEASEEHFSSKRRKGNNSKGESKLKEICNKGESLRMEWKNKDKKYESGSAGEMEISAVVVEKEDGRSKGESKRKSERDYSGQKEGKEHKGMDRRAEKEKEREKENNIGQVSKRWDAKTDLVDIDVGKKQELQSGDLGVVRKVKRGRENSDFPVKVELQNPESEKQVDKRICRRRESSSDRVKHLDDFKEGDERGLSSRSDHAKDVNYKDDKPKDRVYVDKYHEDDHKNDGQRDKKYHEEMKNYNKHRDGKHKEDVGKDAKGREDRHHGDGDRYIRHKDEKHREDGEKDTKGKVDKYQNSADRCRDYSHRKDSERESRRVDDRYRDDGEKNGRHGDVRHYENGDRDDRHRGRDCSGDKSDPRHSNVVVYASDHHSKHSSTHDDSPMHDDRTVRYRDDQGRRGTTEKQDNRDVRSRCTMDQRFDSEKRSVSEARMDSVPDGGRSTSRNADIEHNLSHSRRCRSPSSSSLTPRDNHRLTKQDEHAQADADTLSVSSSFTRNNHLSGSSKSFPPLPPLRTGMNSPLMSGSIEGDSRFKLNSCHRRSGGDPNLGRIQGNPWRGVPSWPSTVPNGFMSFPHPPPHVSFHSVMQPFPAPAMFGIRPPMDSNHPAPYHVSDNDRFSSPVRPMGWHNPVDDSCNPLHSWDASNTVFRDAAHSNGRPGWDHSRSLPGGRGWDTTGDLWKGPRNSACLAMQSHDKENDFSLNIDETLVGQSIRPTQNEQFFPDEQAATNDVSQSTYESEINSVDAPINNLEDTSNLARISKKDDVPFCLVYLSKLDISADLTEPELFNQCRGFIDMDQSIISDIDDLKILFIEGAIEAKVAPHQNFRSSLSETVDDSVFQKAISLYESQKGSFDKVINGEKFSSANLPFTKCDHEDLHIEDNKTEKPSSTSDMQDGKNTLSHVNVELTPPNTSSDAEGYTESAHQNLDLPPANTMVKSEDPVCTKEHDNIMVNLASKLLLKDQIIEKGPLSVESIEGFHAPSPAEMENDDNIEDVMSGVTSYGTLLNSDVCSEAMTPEFVVSESIILSRIHHSPESTH